MEKMIFDANALLAYIYDEENAGKVERILLDAQKTDVKMYISAVNYGEMYYSILRSLGEKKASELKEVLGGIPMEIVPVYPRDAEEAAAYKAFKKMSYADCFATALAKRLGAPVVTGDPEFKEVEKEIKVVWI